MECEVLDVLLVEEVLEVEEVLWLVLEVEEVEEVEELVLEVEELVEDVELDVLDVEEVLVLEEVEDVEDVLVEVEVVVEEASIEARNTRSAGPDVLHVVPPFPDTLEKSVAPCQEAASRLMTSNGFQ